jgi:DNA-binding MarR family transcriptional regulator
MIHITILSSKMSDSHRPPTSVRPGVLDERATSEGLLLALLGQQAMRRLRAAHIAQDLSPRQFHLLGLLHDRGAMTQRELGAVMDVDPSILVTLLNPLEADGLLSRARDPADRRRHVVTLTPAGSRRLDSAAQAQREAEDQLFAGLSEKQRGLLRDLLLALRDSVADEQTVGAPPA